MTGLKPGNAAWVLDPEPNGEVHYVINYAGGPAQCACDVTLPPTHMYMEYDRPDAVETCPVCKTAFETILAVRFRRADALTINDMVVIDGTKRRVTNVENDLHDPDMVTVTHVPPDSLKDRQFLRAARNHPFERAGRFEDFIGLS